MNEAIREVLGEAGAPPLPEPLAGSIVDSHTHLDTCLLYTSDAADE